MAYAALFVALGSGAYAAVKIDSKDVANNSLRSQDLRNGKAVRGTDVIDDSLTGKDLRESTLDAEGFTGLARAAGACAPKVSAGLVCAEALVDIPSRSRLLIVATGVMGAAGNGSCTATVDGSAAGSQLLDQAPEHSHFTVTGLSGFVEPGRRPIRLECSQGSGVESGTIAVFGVGEFD